MRSHSRTILMHISVFLRENTGKKLNFSENSPKCPCNALIFKVYHVFFPINKNRETCLGKHCYRVVCLVEKIKTNCPWFSKTLENYSIHLSYKNLSFWDLEIQSTLFFSYLQYPVWQILYLLPSDHKYHERRF